MSFKSGLANNLMIKQICLLAASSLLVALTSAKTRRKTQIEATLDRIQAIEDTYKVRLDDRPSFQQKIWEDGRQEFPMRLEQFTSVMNE